MTEPNYTWSGRHGLTVSQCVKCKHWNRDATCAAFPEGVPHPILNNEFDHSRQYADEKIVFTPKK